MAHAYLTRPGVFEYLQADGSVRRELRPRDEVYDAESLATLAGKPTCLDHPVDEAGEPILILPENYNAHATGAIIGDAQIDRAKDLVWAKVAIKRREHIDAVEAGRLEQSCGYTCVIDHAPGVDPQWGPYDVIQRKIRYNHTATVERGRAGRDVRLCADAAIQLHPDPTPHTHQEGAVMPIDATATVHVGKHTFTVPASLGPVIAALRADMEEGQSAPSVPVDMTAILERLDAMQAQIDAMKDAKGDEEEGEEEKKDVSPQEERADRMDWLQWRRAHEALAAGLGVEGFETKADADLKRAIAATQVQTLKADASDAYLDALVDIALTHQAKETGGIDAIPATHSLASTIVADRAQGGAHDGRASFLKSIRKGA